MIEPKFFFEYLEKNGIDFFTGVPDSLLKDFCAYVTDNSAPNQHVITANEGSAIAMAVGHFLGSGRPAFVYMQNSGIGNAINPILSLADKEVYSVPMLLMIGWRGELGVKDEPQHVKQGRIMTELLDVLEIPWFEISAATENIESILFDALEVMHRTSSPVAFLVRKGTFNQYTLQSESKYSFELGREQAIEIVAKHLTKDDFVVATTGMASRELFEVRERLSQGHDNDFLTVGAMGHTASIALGLASQQQERKVFCLDGDGSVLMHMGSMAITGGSNHHNLIHIVINNGAHDSVGGQPTAGFNIDLPKIASACGYKSVYSTSSEQSFLNALKDIECTELDGPSFIEIKVNKGSRSNLGRPKTSPLENKKALMESLRL